MTQRKFSERSEEMGLVPIENNSFYYKDSLSKIKYCQTKTFDDIELPVYAIFTGTPDDEEFEYAGIVSDMYKFEGNDALAHGIKDSISEIGSPIFEEFTFLNSKFTGMYKEIILRHQFNTPASGDIYPQVIIQNTYDGHGAKDISFGLSLYEGGRRAGAFKFTHKVTQLRQIHVQGSSTFSYSINSYVRSFSENIIDLVNINMGNTLTDEEIMSTLAVIEELGKKRKEGISKILKDLTEESGRACSSWDVFLAITKFSINENNINAREILSNIAERTIMLPARMLDTLR